MALGDAVRRGRESHPTKPALVVEERTWSYEQFDQTTDRIAGRLLGLGVQPGDRVALHFLNGSEIVFGYYACFKIGAVAVPLNVRLKGSELEYILNHCGARLYLGDNTLFSEVQTVKPRLVSIERFYVAGDGGPFSDIYPFDDLTSPGVEEVVFPPVPDQEPAVILYTSGTTARPKGVTHTHATLERTISHYSRYSGVNRDDVVGLVLPMGHIFALALLVLPTVAAGGTMVVVPRFLPEPALRAFERNRVTQVGALPTMYSALVHSSGAASYDLSSLRFCLAGGDAVPTELQRQFRERFGAEITEACGMTETIPYAGNPAYDGGKTGSIGLPTPGVRLRLVDEQGLDVPGGEAGEILVRSEATMTGYWNDPEATAEALEDGWLRTGDLARVDDDGYFWFVGRKKEIIVRGGSNISPLEVEELLCQHPSVKEVGVVGVPDDTWGEIVKAYVALKEEASTTEEELKQFASARIAAYKVPEEIIFLPELPKGLTGKIHRKTLREWAV